MKSIPTAGDAIMIVDDGRDGEVETVPTNDSKNWSELQCKRVNSRLELDSTSTSAFSILITSEFWL